MKTSVAKELKLLSGTIHTQLAENIARKLGIKLTDVRLDHFANGEIRCQILESVRGADVFVIQTHGMPVNDAIMEQAILIDAAKRASARMITAVCPFFGYARQDRKSSGREPISARLIVDFLKAAGADRIVSVDLHSGQIQGFFDGPFDHLIAMPVLIDHLKSTVDTDFVIVAPDAGRVKLADRFARRLNAELAIIHKLRNSAGVPEAKQLIGSVKSKRCVIVDDMIDGGGTVCAAAKTLERSGATSISVIVTHGLFSNSAAELLDASPIDLIIVTNTLPQNKSFTNTKVELVSVVPLLADAVKAVFECRSVSDLFGGENQT